MLTGGSCAYDPTTDLPDSSCVFVADGDNSAVVGSIMAAPFLNTVWNACFFPCGEADLS